MPLGQSANCSTSLAPRGAPAVRANAGRAADKHDRQTLAPNGQPQGRAAHTATASATNASGPTARAEAPIRTKAGRQPLSARPLLGAPSGLVQARPAQSRGPRPCATLARNRREANPTIYLSWRRARLQDPTPARRVYIGLSSANRRCVANASRLGCHLGQVGACRARPSARKPRRRRPTRMTTRRRTSAFGRGFSMAPVGH